MSDDELRIDAESLRHQHFPSAFRGYETNAVDATMHRLASQIDRLNRYIAQLEDENAKLRDGIPVTAAPAAPPADVDTSAAAFGLALLDEGELVALIGEETARVLGTARRAADEIKRKAEESAARTVRTATEEAQAIKAKAADEGAKIRSEAEAHAAETRNRADAEIAELTETARTARDVAVAEAEEAAQAITTEAEEAAAALRVATDEEVVAILGEAEAARDAAKGEADEIVEEAKREGRTMLEEAKAVRTRMLEDLAERRRTAKAQLERLVAGRDELLAAYHAVQADLDRIKATLTGESQPGGNDLLADPPELVSQLEAVQARAAADAAATAEPAPVAAPPASEPVEEQVATETEPEPEPVVDAEPVAEAEPDDEPDVVEPEPVAEDAPAEPEPEPEQGTDAVVDLRPVDDEGSVDELFARIRQNRADAVESAHEVLGDASADEPEPASVATATATTTVIADDDLEHRAETLRGPGGALAKAVKRVLADEQNDVLDAVRRGVTDPAELLPDSDDHLLSYAAVAHGPLQAVADAAADRYGGGVAPVAALATTMASAIVEPFRARISQEAAAADDADGLDGRLRALYREWKAQHVAAAVDTALYGAYAAGQFVGLDGRVRWLVDPEHPDCDDAAANVAAGSVGKGTEFPSGHACPPSHAACRCLLGPGD